MRQDIHRGITEFNLNLELDVILGELCSDCKDLNQGMYCLSGDSHQGSSGTKQPACNQGGCAETRGGRVPVEE